MPGATQSSAPVEILVYVEDPGAANMVLGLGAALRAEGVQLSLYAAGAALNYLQDRGEAVHGFSDSADIPHFFAEDGPGLVAIGTSENPETPAFTLADAARDRGIPTVCLIDGPNSADRRLRGRGDAPLTHLTDWLLVADDTVRAAFMALGVDAGRIRVTGNPAFDRVRDAGAALAARGRAALRREVFPGLPGNGPLILFLTELSDGLDPAQFQRGPDYTLQGRGGTDGRTEIVLEELLDAAARMAPDAHVALRLHPKTPANLYAAYDREIAAVSAGGSAHAAVFAADLVVGLSTSLLAEAAVMGAAVLSILPRESEAQWLAGGENGPVPHVTTRAALCGALAHALTDPAGFMAARAAAAPRFAAAGRIARALAAVARGKPPAPDGTLPYVPPVLETARLMLQPFPDDLLTDAYVGWLNDPEVVRYSEQRHITHTLESCRDFIASFAGTPNGLWAIRDKTRGLCHIGNISTEVDPRMGTGDIRILIGDRAAWGTGLGAQAWMAVMAHLFDDLGLAQVTAGTLAGNTGMLKVMEKSGMRETHRRPGPTPIDGRAMDVIYARRRAQDWPPAR
ncbi:MAG: GNAT family N-acetyltransferase [Rhodospirillales bacterium]